MLGKADPGNIMFRTDLLGLDFQQGRLLVLDRKFNEAEAKLSLVIEGIKKMGSEEDTGPGDGVLYTWLGEAQFSRKNYAQALQSFQKAVAALESDVQYDDGRTGAITDYVRIGDTQLKLGRLSDAEVAYDKAQAKSDLSSAKNRSDMPAIYAAAEVDQGLGDLWIEKASRAPSPEERARDREKACDAYKESYQIRSLLPNPLRFSPSKFPVTDPGPVSNFKKTCETVAVQATQ